MNMYYIAILAPEEINNKFLIWKNMLKELFGCVSALKSPAHITITPPFWHQEASEDLLKKSIDEFCRNQSSFKIELDNFSCFAPKVIFVDVIKNDQLELLYSKFNEFLLNKSFPIKLNKNNFHPHVTIASRDLYKNEFLHAWEIFSKKKFHTNWSASGLSLLRHNKKKWDVIYTSRFEKANPS